MQISNFFDNSGGLNNTDSPFKIADEQATGGYNYQYDKTGGISKRSGHYRLNTAANAQLKSLGLGLWFNTTTATKTVVRVAGTKFQTVVLPTSSFTNISDDTATPTSDFFNASSTSAARLAPFNSGGIDITWAAGAGASSLLGFNGTKLTTNGATSPKGVITASVISSSGGSWDSVGNYWYSVVFRKASTQITSNASLDVLAVIANVTDTVVINLSGITSFDHTKYDQIWIYRSATNGVTGFSTGSLITQLPASATSFTDSGQSIDILSDIQVPRAGNVGEDHSTLPVNPQISTLTKTASWTTGSITVTVNARPYVQAFVTDNNTSMLALAAQVQADQDVASANVSGSPLNVITVIGKEDTQLTILVSSTGGAPTLTLATTQVAQSAFIPTDIVVWKNRLVTYHKNQLFISEFNQSEYWPSNADVTLPGGNAITAIAVVGFSTDFNADEKLIVFTENTMYQITGTGLFNNTIGLYDYTLNFIDYVGCPASSLAVRAFGNMFWITYRGVYMFSGAGKPVRISRGIEQYFANDGDLDKSRITRGFGTYFQKANKIHWVLSDKLVGENKGILSLDLRLTMNLPASVQGNLYEMYGVFNFDKSAIPLYSATSVLPDNTFDEIFLSGDNAGYLYRMYVGSHDSISDPIDFSYKTKAYDLGSPYMRKRFIKVHVWIDDLNVAKNLTLNWWTDYRNRDAQRSKRSLPMQAASSSSASLWDSGYWDVAMWDDSYPTAHLLTFNLDGAQNNAEGSSIQLEFVQGDLDAPIAILGWSILWDDISVRS